ncbi:MAG TPA: ArsR family transcriptional regulator, partial [Candidatus Microbacterium pullistercoris]|nr:ArsR family transcriptional regulator [Candidatus Microbacterium pullistercoris]
EDPSRARDRRDRVWVPAIRSITFGSAEDPIADEALGAVVVDGHIADHGDIVRRAAAWSMEYLTGRDAVMHGVMSRHAARLTPDEFRDLHQRIQALIDEARTNHDESAPSHMYEIDIVAADDAI